MVVMKWGKFLLGSLTTVLLVLMITPLAMNPSSNPVPRAADTYDSYDPNSSFGNAKSIPAGLTNNLYVDHDDDWFYIYVANSYRLSMILNWTGGADLDLYLFDSNQKLLNYSFFASPEKVSLEVITPGDYYVCVSKYSGSETLYSLNVNNTVRTQNKLLTLLDAYSNSNLSVLIYGTGSIWGNSLSIDIEWLTGFTEYSGVRIYIPLGLVLQAYSSSYTELIIAYAMDVTLTYTGDWEIVYPYAFSTDFDLTTPSSSIALSPYAYYYASTDTYKVLAYCAGNDYYLTPEGQVAVWATIQGAYSVSSQYHGSYSVVSVNAILSGAGTSLHLDPNAYNLPLFFTVFIPIIIIIVAIVIVAVAVSVKRKGGFSRRIAVKPTMTEQPYRPPVTFASPPQPTVISQAQSTSIWNQPAFQQAPAPKVGSPATYSKDRSCTLCGARLDATERFCHNCGVDMEAKQ